MDALIKILNLAPPKYLTVAIRRNDLFLRRHPQSEQSLPVCLVQATNWASSISLRRGLTCLRRREKRVTRKVTTISHISLPRTLVSAAASKAGLKNGHHLVTHMQVKQKCPLTTGQKYSTFLLICTG